MEKFGKHWGKKVKDATLFFCLLFLQSQLFYLCLRSACAAYNKTHFAQKTSSTRIPVLGHRGILDGHALWVIVLFCLEFDNALTRLSRRPTTGFQLPPFQTTGAQP